MDIKSCEREFHGLIKRDEKTCLDKLFLHTGVFPYLRPGRLLGFAK